MPAKPTPNFFSAPRRVTDSARLLASSSNWLFITFLSLLFVVFLFNYGCHGYSSFRTHCQPLNSLNARNAFLRRSSRPRWRGDHISLHRPCPCARGLRAELGRLGNRSSAARGGECAGAARERRLIVVVEEGRIDRIGRGCACHGELQHGGSIRRRECNGPAQRYRQTRAGREVYQKLGMFGAVAHQRNLDDSVRSDFEDAWIGGWGLGRGGFGSGGRGTRAGRRGLGGTRQSVEGRAR